VLTKFDFRQLLRDALDDPKQARWKDEILDLFTGLTLDSMWGELLQIDPFVTNQVDTLTSLTSPGYIDKRLSSLPAAFKGDLSQRLYRIKSIVRNGRELEEGDARNFVLENDILLAGFRPAYWHIGDRIYVTPLDTADDVEVSYSFKPASYNDQDDGDDVVWPDGYETAPIYETSGRMLTKGGAEDNQGHLILADSEFGRLKAAVQRRSLGPVMILNMDDDVGWGGT